MAKKFNEQDLENNLRDRLSLSSDYTDKIILLNYLFIQVLETSRGEIEELRANIENIYMSPNRMWIEIQEFDHVFVDFMSRYISADLEIEEILIQIQTDLALNIYD